MSILLFLNIYWGLGHSIDQNRGFFGKNHGFLGTFSFCDTPTKSYENHYHRGNFECW